MSFYERYQAGEREQVWRELLALGRDVREEAHYPDAVAVARETMLRARDNIETLIGRLHRLGYKFQTAADTLGNFATRVPQVAAQQVAALRSGQFPEINRALLEGIGMGPAQIEAHLQRLANPGALDFLAQMAARIPKPANPLHDPSVYTRAGTGYVAAIEETEERLCGPLPISLRAWYEQIGHVSFIGSHPELNPATQKSMSWAGVTTLLEIPGDLLAIGGISELTEFLDDPPERGMGPYPPVPDGAHEVYLTGHNLNLPDSRADTLFQSAHSEYLVPFLRRVIEWGGFPGWERHANAPTALLRELTEGLLPI